MRVPPEHRPTVLVAHGVARLLVAPLLVAHRAGLISFHSAGQLLSLVPGALGMHLRRAWYRATLAGCGRGLRVQFGAVLRDAGTRVGDGCIIGEYTCIGLADIGSHVMTADHVSVVSGRRGHVFDRRDIPMASQPAVPRRVAIGDDVWVGAGARIAADVASHSIVGAGAVVLHTFDPWRVLAGVPARSVGERP